MQINLLTSITIIRLGALSGLLAPELNGLISVDAEPTDWQAELSDLSTGPTMDSTTGNSTRPWNNPNKTAFTAFSLLEPEQGQLKM